MSKSIPIISLFCGPGGMDVGFERAGFSVVYAADFEPDAVRTFNANRAESVAHQVDLADSTPEMLLNAIESTIGSVVPRGVIGGPPCQAFSLANVNQKNRDRRKMLVLRYAEHIKALNKKYNLDFVVFENVPGLRAKKNSSYLNRFKKVLNKAGFQLWEQELNAIEHGVAQNRRRVFVIGINRRKFGNARFRFPEDQGTISTVRDILWGLPEPAYFSRDLKLCKIPKHPNHWTMRPRSIKFSHAGRENGRSFRKLQWDKPSWTVAYGNREIHLHPNSPRRLSVYEAMLLQGFPKKYRLYGNFSSQVKQISNAVPPPLARAVARGISELLYRRCGSVWPKLKKWYAANQRTFPWRQHRSPYSIMVAEKMLQQTRATKTVVSAYEMFMRKYPTVKLLANARVSEISKLLHPLGFHYRAKEIIALADDVVRRHKNNIPMELEALKSLPGIGDYSARAIRCFGFNIRSAIVDANVARFISRMYGLTKLYTNPARSPELLYLAEKLLPQSGTVQFNFALLDFCAQTCKAVNPCCSLCPLKKECDYARSKSAASRAA